MKKATSVEEYIETSENFSDALTLLREIMCSTELEETLKWSAPVYTVNGKNVIGLGAFKKHFGIWFYNGVLLKDEHKLLTNAQESKTKALRQMKFNSIEEIDKNIVLKYVQEAIENQKAGKEIKPDRTKKELTIPDQLKNILKENLNLKDCFESLAPYKQREYCEHIASAKHEATKLNRLEKIVPLILEGKGLNDKYKNC